MRVVALISGGKDSCFNMMQCVAEGHELVALANLYPEEVDELDSYMFQTVGHRAIDLYSQAMGLPLYRAAIRGASVEQGRDYQPTEGDEVEDLYLLLKKIQDELRVEGVSVGAILSNYQRVRVENVCLRLGLTPLAYLWRRDQSQLLQEMIQAKVQAIIIKVAALGLTEKQLGKSLAEIQPHMELMKTKYQLNVCGEGGEYETFALDCPLFAKRIVIDSFEVVRHDDYDTSPVLYIRFGTMHLADKHEDIEKLTFAERIQAIEMMRGNSLHRDLKIQNFLPDSSSSKSDHSAEIVFPADQDQNPTVAPFCRRGEQGFAWIGGINATCDAGSSCVSVGQSTKDAMDTLKDQLSTAGYTLRDAVLIHLYVRNMADFASINSVYCQYFQLNPPARVCVQASLPEDTVLQLDCVAHHTPAKCSDDDGGGGDCGGRDPAHFRSTMHVQGLSHWAPANIGPYSQAVQIGSLIFCAGMIPLCPSTMAVIEGGMNAECCLSLRSTSRVLAAMHRGIGLRDVVAATCYVTESGMVGTARKHWQLAVEQEEAVVRDDDYESSCLPSTAPSLVNYVIVPHLPRGCLVEWHVVASTNKQSWDYERTNSREDWISVETEIVWCEEMGAASILARVDSHPHAKEVSLEGAIHRLCSSVHAAMEGHGFCSTHILSFKVFHSQGQIPQAGVTAVLRGAMARVCESTVPFVSVPVISLGPASLLSASVWLQRQPGDLEEAGS